MGILRLVSIILAEISASGSGIATPGPGGSGPGDQIKF